MYKLLSQPPFLTNPNCKPDTFKQPLILLYKQISNNLEKQISNNLEKTNIIIIGQ